MVRYLLASSIRIYQFAHLQYVAEIKGWAMFVSIQNYYKLIDQEKGMEIDRYCNMTGVRLIGISTFLSFSQRNRFAVSSIKQTVGPTGAEAQQTCT